MIKQILHSILLNTLLFCYVTADQIPFVTQQQIILADFNQPSAVIVTKNDKVFVLDGLKQRIIVYNLTVKELYEIDLKMTGDTLSAPMDLLLIGNRILVADTGGHRLIEYSLEGRVLQIINLKELMKDDKKLPEPVSLWREDDFFYWSDRANHQICKMHLKQYKLIRCFGTYGDATKQFRFPFQMATDRDGYLYTVDVLNARVQVFNSRGKYFSQIGRFGLNKEELFRPNGIAINKDDYVFISDSYLGHISIFKTGRFIGYLMDSNNHPIYFSTPVYLKLHQDHLFVVDALKNSVVQLSLSYTQQKEMTCQFQKPIEQVAATKKMSSEKNCIICHVSWEDKKRSQLLALSDKKILPVASEKMCYSCHHGVVVESRIAILKKHQHPTIYSEKNKSHELNQDTEKDKIPDIFPLSEKDELLCTSCHSPHNSDVNQEVLYQGHKNSWMRISNQGGDLCEQCHESKNTGARTVEQQGINHPLAIKFLAPATKNNELYVQETHLQQGLPEAIVNNGGVLDKQQQLICQTCHQIHAGEEKNLLTLANTQSELCISCHKSKYVRGKEKAHQQGIHPVNIKLEKAIEYKGKIIEDVTCASCHKVHDGNVGTSLLWDTTEQTIEDICIACHQRYTADSVEEATRKGIHPANIKLAESVKVEGKTIKTITCLTCHSVHQGKKNTASLVQSDQDGKLCKNCHKEEQQVFNTDHDFRLTASDKKNRHDQLAREVTLCGSCHSMHKGYAEKEVYPFLYAAKIVTEKTEISQKMDKVLLQRDQLCINCHQENGIAEKKVVNHFSHPYKDLILRSDAKKMPLLKMPEKTRDNLDLGIKENHEFGMIACVTCHDPHIWKPDSITEELEENNRKNQEGDGTNSFLRQIDTIDTFCVSCHGIETRIKYKYYHDKLNARNIGIEYLK